MTKPINSSSRFPSPIATAVLGHFWTFKRTLELLGQSRFPGRQSDSVWLDCTQTRPLDSLTFVHHSNLRFWLSGSINRCPLPDRGASLDQKPKVHSPWLASTDDSDRATWPCKTRRCSHLLITADNANHRRRATQLCGRAKPRKPAITMATVQFDCQSPSMRPGCLPVFAARMSLRFSSRPGEGEGGLFLDGLDRISWKISQRTEFAHMNIRDSDEAFTLGMM